MTYSGGRRCMLYMAETWHQGTPKAKRSVAHNVISPARKPQPLLFSRLPMQGPEITTTGTLLEHYSEATKKWKNGGKWVKMCHFGKTEWKNGDKPKRWKMVAFSVDGTQGGKWGKVGKNRAEVGMKGSHVVHGMGPLSHCCLPLTICTHTKGCFTFR